MFNLTVKAADYFPKFCKLWSLCRLCEEPGRAVVPAHSGPQDSKGGSDGNLGF